MKKDELIISHKAVVIFILVMVWMSLIFYFSHQPGSVSSAQSNMVKELIFNNINSQSDLFKNIMNSGVVMFFIRKSAHMFLYFILSILVYSLSRSMNNEFSWSIKISMLVSVIYAALDEIHQLYIVGRSGLLTDVWIDSIGVFLGVLLISIIELCRFKKYTKQKKLNEMV